VRGPFYWWSLWSGGRDVDIVHIFSALYWSFLVALVPSWLIGRLRSKRVLANYHSGEARNHLRHWRTAWPVLRRADQLVVPSTYLVEVFREFGQGGE
jgi:L-malate glycosyltransferase